MGWAQCNSHTGRRECISTTPALPAPHPHHPPPAAGAGHYDVQPANEDTWRHDPFELHSVDGWLYGRGTTDNKGGWVCGAPARLAGWDGAALGTA